jgi:hypothetical protein
MRDLDFLRDDHHAPIAYDDSRKGFKLTDPSERGFADVWRKDCFGWEYKGKKKSLDLACKQLQPELRC